MNQDFSGELAEYFKITKEEAGLRVTRAKEEGGKEWEAMGRRHGEFHQKSIWQIYRMMRPRPKIEQFLKEIVTYCMARGDKKILDYGCGVGNYSIPLSYLGFDVTAVDYQDSEVLKFMKWRADNKYINIEILGHNDKWDREGYYDAIVFYDVLEHVDNPLELFKKLHRSLKSKGILYFTFSPHPGMTDMERIENECYPFLRKYFYRQDVHIWLHK